MSAASASAGPTANATDAFGHFVEAQARVIDVVREELRGCRKRSHWMWFVFPQLAGLGRSATAQRFALHSMDEARGYLDHPVLGPRLRECTRLANECPDPDPSIVFGYPDDLKFHSSMTLFARAAEEGTEFRTALERYFDGREDAGTLRLLGEAHSGR